MKSKIIWLLIGALSLNLLTACGYIKSLFPDKEKDYQYTTEIPPLVIPPDLTNDASLKDLAKAYPTKPEEAAIPLPVQAAVEPETQAAVESTPVNAASATSKPSTSPSKHEAIASTLQKTNDGVALLHLDTNFESAWRAVDKALSRKSIEVTNRDKVDRSFKLHYDPDEKALEDHSFWHEAFFMFNRSNSNEQEFILKLTQQGQYTDVTVLDKDQKPAKDSSATRLLTLLQDTIKSDFAK